MPPIAERAAKYLVRMPHATAGNGGHTATFRAALVLIRGFALSPSEALPVLLQWNHTHCDPPWKKAELEHKLKSAQSSNLPLGYLLRTETKTLRSCPSKSISACANKVRQHGSWPKFRIPTESETYAISSLRNLPGSALHKAIDSGLLRISHYNGTLCYILTEGHFAQARRLDGLPLLIGQKASKTKNLPGAVGSFIGASLLDNTSNVLLVEGCISLLEALGCIAFADANGWTAIAATSATSRFHRAKDLLAKLKGRTVRIVPDSDDAGLEAAATWLADLESTGAVADAIALPQGCKDLGDIVSEPLIHEAFLTTLFQ